MSDSIVTKVNEAIGTIIEDGENLMFDTTFSNSTKKMDKIIKYITTHKKTYDIYVVRFLASVDKIIERIKLRHEQMRNKNYCRAIPPNPEIINKIIEANKGGFDRTREKYGASIKFLEVDNNDLANPIITTI